MATRKFPSIDELISETLESGGDRVRERGGGINSEEEELKHKVTQAYYPMGGAMAIPIPKKILESTQKDKPHNQRVKEFLDCVYSIKK